MSTGGGGGGSYAKSTDFLVTSSTFGSGYQFSVGPAGGIGSNGGDTWFYNTLCLAPGGKPRGNAQQKSPLNQFIQTSYYGGGGGSSWRNIFNQIWHGGGGAAGRRSADGNVGGNADYNFTGGGAEGGAYDNGNASIGRGGQDGANSPGVPGGGGAGNQSGAVGIIIISYTCNYSPGSIKESHTVPFPAEWGPFNDAIYSATSPTAIGYRLKWEGSKNSVTWDSLGIGSGLNTFVQDSITLNTFYRRTIANGCGKDNSTPPVLIKVFKATSGKNGKITGRVTSVNGTTGVGGVTITAKKTFALKGSPQSFPYTATTNANGDYIIPDIFYGDRDNGDPAFVGFTIVASLPGHRLSTRDSIRLSYNTNISDGNNFIDSTVYSITGRVTQTCPSCLPGYNDTIGVGNVKIATNTPGVIDVYTDSLRVRQDSIGYFAMAIANPGSYLFTPTFLNHSFTPVNRNISVASDIFDINFLDTTTRLISGKLTDVGGRRLGNATLLFEGIYQRRDSLPITTFKKRTRINAGDSIYSVRLPAGTYRVYVDSFSSAFPISDDRYIREDSIKNFFKNLAPEPLIDISSKDSVRNLVYHRPPVVKIFGLKDTACNVNAYLNPRLVLRTNLRKRFEAFVFEGPESIGDKVTIFDSGDEWPDSLANYLRFYTNVTKRGAIENADTLYFRLKNTTGPQVPMIDSFLIPGAPNIVRPFRKPFFIYYYDRYGRKATISPTTPIPDSATVVGSFSPTNTFTTVSPEIPFLILHQPPGDKSYSFWAQDESIQTSTTIKAASETGVDGFVNVSLGPKWSLDVAPIFGAGVGVEIATIATFNYTHQNLVIADTLDELVTTTTIKNRFQTNPGNIFTDGISGDVYIGNAMNYILGKSITVDFIPLRPMGQCEIDSASRLFMAPDSVKTEFVYTENNLEKVIIPTQQRLADQATTDSARTYHKTQVDVWRQVIDNNKLNKKNAKFIRNRSFSAGPGVDYSEENSKSSSRTITWETMVSSNFAAELGLYVGGLGASAGVNITLQQTTGGSKSTSSSSTNEIGYHLEDDDIDGNGDYYSVNIKKDSVYGTPVFDLYAGTSSCPPEQGAQNRDQPQILSGDMRFDNLDTKTPKFFDIILTNKSESGEPRNYDLSVDATTSEGVTISASGSNNLVTAPIPYYSMQYGTSKIVRIQVEKLDSNDRRLSYPNVEFYLADKCGNGPQIPNTYSTAKITFNYASPCGGINLTSPADGFVVNTTNPLQLPITMGGYTLNNIDSITLQYQKKVTSAPRAPGMPWVNGFTVKRNAITDPNSFTNIWNIAALPDSIYNLRLRLVCTNGDLIYSDAIAGVVDRKAPLLVGEPQPITGLYIPGSSNISFRYTEPIDNANLNNGTVELLRRSNNSLVPITVIAINETLVITPAIDLGLQKDSFRVIVRNIADRFGNIKSRPDTSFFTLGKAQLPPYTGSNTATVFATPTSIPSNSTGKLELHFQLSEKARQITRIYFNLSGSAVLNSDYNISYDTIIQKRCLNANCSSFESLPVYNQFSGNPGFVNIDSNKTEVIIYLSPIENFDNIQDKTISINLVSGADYKLQQGGDVANITILKSALPCPPANILYVNEKATGNNSGVSWSNAMRSVKEALNSTCPGVTQIWVAKGTYKPTTNNSRDSSFVMKNNLAIYGGFAGTETALSQRNIRINPTILSGDIGIANSNADNSYNVVRNISNGLNNTAILDGFIVTGGNGNGAGFGSYGAGVINVNSTASFFNCSIIANNASIYGGGMYNNGTSPIVVNSVFAGNTALYGGGLYNESAATKLINCSFSGNLATVEGGAISTYGAVVPEITNSILWGNSSGIRNAGGSLPNVTYSIVQGGYTGTGNLTVDPLFIVQPAPALGNTADLRLQGCSPAINLASNAALPAGITSDRASSARIVNTNIDMGAYERQSPATSVIIYVDATATGNNSGESWANAYNNLSSAITELNFCSPGTTIQVATGTYTAPINSTYNFDKLGASILGGFPAGGGTRNPVANPVILKGNVQVLKSVNIDGLRVQKQ